MANTFTLFAGVEKSKIEADGSTVGDVRARFEKPYKIGREQTALINGEAVDDDFVPSVGDELTFSKPTGQKGRR